jgi:hypothetical protein
MGNRTDDDTAAGRLGTLLAHFKQHPVTGPAERGPASVTPGTPVNLSVVDHITASVREVVDDTLAANPAASPLPARVEAVYGWYMANTAHAPEAVRQRRDTIVYRQRLEHALAAGDRSVVRPHRCPACRTFGLFWRPELGKAVCTNGDCLTKDGLSRKWTLAKLAYEHVAAMSEKAVRDCAT